MLADVYLNLTREQFSLIESEPVTPITENFIFDTVKLDTDTLPIIPASTDELSSHTVILESLNKSSNGNCTWYNNSNK